MRERHYIHRKYKRDILASGNRNAAFTVAAQALKEVVKLIAGMRTSSFSHLRY